MMPRSSIADLIVDWETLLSTLKSSAVEVPSLDIHMTRLEQVVLEAKDMTARVETNRGLKQQESQQRRDLLKRGKDLASRVRAALKAHFGLQNERLVEFGVRPIRSRSRSRSARNRKKQEPAAQPAAEPSSTTEPP
jgi:hypothetical protein